MAESSSPQDVVTRMFEALDAMDTDAIKALLAAEPEAVDELSGGWLRGRDALEQYLGELDSGEVSDMRSRVGDVHVSEWGDTAVITLVLDQTYTLDGEEHAVHSPSTIVLRREDGDWRIALIHSVPLPES